MATHGFVIVQEMKISEGNYRFIDININLRKVGIGPGVYKISKGSETIFVTILEESPGNLRFAVFRKKLPDLINAPPPRQAPPPLPQRPARPTAPHVPETPPRKGIGFLATMPDSGNLFRLFDLLDPKIFFGELNKEALANWQDLNPHQRDLVFEIQDPSTLSGKVLAPGQKLNMSAPERSEAQRLIEMATLWREFNATQKRFILDLRTRWSANPQKHFLREIFTGVQIIRYKESLRGRRGESRGKVQSYQISSTSTPLTIVKSDGTRIELETGDEHRQSLGTKGKKVEIYVDGDTPLRVILQL